MQPLEPHRSPLGCRKRVQMGLAENTGVCTVESKMFVGGSSEFSGDDEAKLDEYGKCVSYSSGGVKPGACPWWCRIVIRSLVSVPR